MKFFIGMAALVILGCSSAPLFSTGPGLFQKYVQYVPNQADPSKRVEFFFAHPDDLKKHPVLIFVHGHQEKQRSGGYQQIAMGRFEENIKRGYATVSVSQPGFGGSDGPEDLSGPLSQAALLSVLQWVVQNPAVDADNMALYGSESGALTAALASLKFRRLKAMILSAGQYNLHAALGSDDRFNLPTLILHGEKDGVAPYEDALHFANELKKRNVDARLMGFPEIAHFIPTDKSYDLIYPFLQEFLSMPGLSPLLEQVYLDRGSEEDSKIQIFKICQKTTGLCPRLQGKLKLHSSEFKKEGILQMNFDLLLPGSVLFLSANNGKSGKELAALYTGRKTVDGDLIILATGHTQKRGWIETPLQSILSSWNYSFNGWVDITGAR